MKLRFDIEQNTDEWHQIKVAKFSASTCSDLLMDKKTKGYSSLINRIIEERITSIQSESRKFSGNQFTERGHEYEPIAAEDYELRNLIKLDLIGVIELDEWVLCSPDRLIGKEGLYQVKCPIFSTQKEYLKIYTECINNKMTDNEILYKLSSVYYKQMQFELFVSDRKYNIFNSYHPYLKAIDLKILRDEKMILEIINRIFEAKNEIQQEIHFLKNL